MLKAIKNIFKVPGVHSTKQFKKNRYGLSSKLIYFGLVDEGIILNIDGSLMASYWFRGYDLESSTPEELSVISARINKALTLLDFGFVLHIDSIRYSSSGYVNKSDNHFNHITLELIDEERRILYNQENIHFENAFIITFTWLPPSDFSESFSRFFFGKKKNRKPGIALDEAIVRFKDNLREVTYILASAFTLLTQLSSEEMLTYLHRCITGLEHPMRIPNPPYYLQSILASKDLVSDSYPIIGNNYIKIISVYNFPNESYPGIMDILNRITFEYRWTTRFIYIKQKKAQSYIKKTQDLWGMKRLNIKEWFMTTVDQTARVRENRFTLRQEDDADIALEDLSSGVVKFGFYTNTITIMDENEESVIAKAEEVSRILTTLGFSNQIEKINAVDAYFGALPGYSYENVRKPALHTLNLADLMPQTAIWAGRECNPCPYYGINNPPLMFAKTTGSTPFRFNLHVADKGHTLILGPTRSGKSTFLGLLIAQHFRYKDAKVFVFDKGRSLLPLCYASGGIFYDLLDADTEELRLQPLANLGNDKFELVWAQQWIESLCELQGLNMDIHKRTAITKALELVASNNSNNKTLSEIQQQITDETIREALKPYTSETSIGAIFDGNEDHLKLSNFTVFETEKLMNSSSDQLIIPVITYLVHKIQSQLTGSPTLLVFDEFWLYLSHPVFKAFIVDFIKSVAKLNVAVIFATQQPADLFNSDIKETLIENLATLVLLPNSKALSDTSSKHYFELGVNETQLRMIAESQPKRYYFAMSDEGQRLFELGLGDTPGALAFIGNTGKEDIDKAKRIKQEHGDLFAYYWLKEYALEAYADTWMKMYKAKTINISKGL